MFDEAQKFVRGVADALTLEARRTGVLRSLEATHVSRWLHSLAGSLRQASNQAYAGKTLLLYGAASPDDLRELGWHVAVHNDYYQNGSHHTFWLMTKGTVCFKGEGLTDEAALDLIRSQVEAHNSNGQSHAKAGATKELKSVMTKLETKLRKRLVLDEQTLIGWTIEKAIEDSPYVLIQAGGMIVVWEAKPDYGNSARLEMCHDTSWLTQISERMLVSAGFFTKEEMEEHRSEVSAQSAVQAEASERANYARLKARFEARSASETSAEVEPTGESS